MKIAICECEINRPDSMSAKSLQHFEKLLSVSGHSVDYFSHRWDSNTSDIMQTTTCLVESPSKKEQLIESLSMLPEKLLLKSIMFYGLMRSANLKINHELTNNISYDICIGICGNKILFPLSIIAINLKAPKINTVYTHGGMRSTLYPYFSFAHDFFMQIR